MTTSPDERICSICSFDQTVISFAPVPEARGLTDDRLTWVLEFPPEIWEGWEYCSECNAVSSAQSRGAADRARTRALREALAYLESGTYRTREHPTLVVTLT